MQSINGPVDVWLAQHAGYLPAKQCCGFVPEADAPVRHAHAKLDFGGHVSGLDGACHAKLDPCS